MPNIKSAKKRVKVSARQHGENVSKKSAVKTAIKKYEAAIAAKDIATAEKLLPETISLIDRAKNDDVFHDNTASRKVATLSRSLSALKGEKAE